MAALDLTTLANVKGWLRLGTATDDVLLSRMIEAYSRYVQTWLERNIKVAAYAETRDGNGRAAMTIGNPPVVSVSRVEVDRFSIPASPDGIAPGHAFTDGTIYLVGHGFNRGRANVRLAYTAGFFEVPADLEQAVIELIGLRYREIDRIGHSSKSLAGETVSFIVKDFPDSVRTILDRYRKVLPL